ncbi:VCBS domain-containing protein, partial [Pseudovibrio japonicus]|uniref:VCBS domain-containing protein n=1 Tax=Pseudovibrio japonicus TaxID=366534 RepID=UPI0016746C7E
GAPRDSEGNVYAGGSVVVRQPDGFGGVIELKLTAPDGISGGQFGKSVSINEAGVLVVGAAGDDDSGYQSGAIYVYIPDGSGGFADPVKLTATEGSAGNQFGSAVAVSDNGIIVSGAPQSSADGLFTSGSVEVFVPLEDGGYESITLTAPDGATGAFFGSTVSVNDAGLVIVGAVGDDDHGPQSGSVYVYQPDGFGGYRAPVKLTLPEGIPADQFGTSVTTNEAGVIVVGAQGTDGTGYDTGSAYVYVPTERGEYSTPIQLIASDATAQDGFGNSVAINEAGVIVVGASMDDAGAAAAGSVYVYVPDGQGGYTQTKLLADDGALGDRFGSYVAISADGTILVGVPGDDDKGYDSGSVYVFQPDALGNYTHPANELALWETTDTSPITQSLQLAFTDVDVSDDDHTASITDASATGVTTGLSSISEEELKTLLDVTGVTSSTSSVEGAIDLTFSAASTVFDYLAAGEQVELVFIVTLDDGNGGIATQPVTVTIVGTNDAPIVSDIAATTSEDDSVLIEPAYIDPDASDAATITFDASATTGEVSFVDGKFQYNPNGQFEQLAVGESATDSFTYTVSDGTAEPVTRTVTVTITGANDAPVVSDIAISTSEDSSVLIEPVFTDADSSDTHIITFDASSTAGEVSLVDGKFQYDPNGQFEHLAVGET